MAFRCRSVKTPAVDVLHLMAWGWHPMHLRCTVSVSTSQLHVRRVALSLGSGIVIAVLTARTVLPVAVRLLAKHATPELYQLTVVAFCLCSGWVSGYMVRLCSVHLLCTALHVWLEMGQQNWRVLITLKLAGPASLKVLHAKASSIYNLQDSQALQLSCCNCQPFTNSLW